METLVAIVIFSLVVTSIGSCLVMAHRINARSEVLMQEQLKVSRAVEGLMATGVTASAITIGGGETTDLATIRTAVQEQYPDVHIALDWGKLTEMRDEDGDGDLEEVEVGIGAFYEVVIWSEELPEDVRVVTYIRSVEEGGGV